MYRDKGKKAMLKHGVTTCTLYSFVALTAFDLSTILMK
jgi:hypothetical protein